MATKTRKAPKAVDPLDAVYATRGSLLLSAAKRESRICFGLVWFPTEALADAYAATVRTLGITYNGGYFDGMPCGRATSFDTTDASGAKLFAVTD